MKRTLISSVLVVGLICAGTSPVAEAQRQRNPGGSSGGGSSSSGGGSSSSGGSSSGGNTGSVATPRGGGSSSWGSGSGASRSSQPSSSGRSAPARTPGGGSGGGSGGGVTPGYSRARGDSPITGYAVPRGSIATLPPIISGPIYWGPGDWYFYPWGYGALALGYFWDPWMWGGYYGGGYPWVDPGIGGVGGGFGGWDSTASTADNPVDPANPLDPNLPTGAIRLKVEPRDAEVYVDGFYAGRVDDFDGARQKLSITRGAHQIELRLAGYETTTFNVTIVVGETTTYKTTLKRK